jgi:hypothetical protein
MGFGLYDMAKEELHILTWESTQGTVVESGTVWLERTKNRPSPGPAVTIRYRYEVAGRQYESTRVTPGGPLLFDELQQATAFRDRYPPGAAINVLYDPDAPREAALMAEHSPAPRVMAGGGSLFLLVVLCLRHKRLRSGKQPDFDVGIEVPVHWTF